MNKLRLVLMSFLTVFTLLGCPSMAPLQAPVAVENESPQAKALRLAHVAVNEANAALTALNRAIGANVKSKAWTSDQAQAYLDQSKAYGEKVTQARKALDVGDFTSAQSKAEAVKSLILVLHSKVAEAARKEN